MVRHLFLSRVLDQPLAYRYPPSVLRAMENVTNIDRWLAERIKAHPHQPVYENLRWEWAGAKCDYRHLTRLQRRMVIERNMPAAYALGDVYWDDMRFLVKRPILIPRFDTLAWIKKLDLSPYRKILEVGFGSGCISLTLARLYEELQFTAIDVAKKALRLAKQNQQLHAINNVEFVLADLSQYDMSRFDVIISNPPYIRHVDRVTKVSPSTRRWESALALHAWQAGTEYHRQLIDKFMSSPKIKMLAMELDGTMDQFKMVKHYAQQPGLSIVMLPDDAGRPRAVSILRGLQDVSR